ncbi:MAG: GAF domain-containing protein [Betaproteobacteria bacterium]|nr:GAF domain-containing protein [Betaproteobacteria bacterium]
MKQPWDGTERRNSPLRELAEQLLAATPPPARESDPETLLHELQVHQIELEMQNEALRQAQVALEESRDRYVDLYEFAPVGYLTLNHDGLITGVNLTGAALLGVERRQLLQRRFDFCVAPEDRALWRRLIHTTQTEGERRHDEITLQRGGNAPFRARLDCQRLTQDGAPSGLRLAFTDISDQLRREAQIRHLNRILRTVSACNEDLVRARSEPDLLQDVCRDIVEIGGYLLAWVAEAAPKGANTPVAWHGDKAAYQVHLAMDHDPDHLRHCLVNAALDTRQTQVCNQLNSTPECRFDELSRMGVAAALSLPLLNDGQVLGALTIFSSQTDNFDAAEVALMEELAADLAFGIAALRTSRERDRYQLHFGQAMQSTVTAMARTLEMRDPYTSGHQQRVTGLAMAIAGELGLSAAQQEGLKFGGMIHDIGKISVPAEILAKPGSLTPVEMLLIREHPETGRRIVADIEFPWPMAQMIVQHHERLDGSGYPFGLKGSDILLEARILAVADVVEAMSSHRPYRAGLGVAAALAEVERGSGAQYDADVVAACIKVVQGNDMRLPE